MRLFKCAAITYCEALVMGVQRALFWSMSASFRGTLLRPSLFVIHKKLRRLQICVTCLCPRPHDHRDRGRDRQTDGRTGRPQPNQPTMSSMHLQICPHQICPIASLEEDPMNRKNVFLRVIFNKTQPRGRISEKQCQIIVALGNIREVCRPKTKEILTYLAEYDLSKDEKTVSSAQ